MHARRDGKLQQPGLSPADRPFSPPLFWISRAGRFARSTSARKASLRSHVSLLLTKKPMRSMMAEIDAVELPDELLDIEVLSEMPLIDRLDNEPAQKAPPPGLHGKDFVPHRTIDIVQLEQPRRHRTLRRGAPPAGPMPHQCRKQRSPAGAGLEPPPSPEQHLTRSWANSSTWSSNPILHLVLGAEVREEPALRHPHPFGKAPQASLPKAPPG